MQKSALILLITSLVILTQSCSRQKGYFQQNVVQNYQKTNVNIGIEPIEIFKKPIIIKSDPILTSSIVENFAVTSKVSEEVTYKEKIIKLEKVLTANKTFAKPQKLNFVQKVIIQKMQKRVANAATPVGFYDWNPYLKIGVILLGIGIILAIFGLGVIGGISAFIGLIFTILGLLSSV